MTTDKFKRVLWRLKEWEPTGYIKEDQLQKAIMLEIGTDERTIKHNKEGLLKLKWLKRIYKHRYKIQTTDEVF